MAELLIRKAAVEDVDGLLELYRQLASSGELPSAADAAMVVDEGLLAAEVVGDGLGLGVGVGLLLCINRRELWPSNDNRGVFDRAGAIRHRVVSQAG